ncbi:MAG: glycosyltransferase [Pseudonocardia sp.]
MGGTRSSSRRYPRLRDRSIFVGNPGDLVDVPLGPDLPTVREWALERYAFPGYVSGSTPPADREALRAELGYRPDERVCLVTVGGSGVGGHLLRRAVEAFPHLEKRVPGLRMIAVAGPRIDPRSIPAPDGVEVHGYVPDLHRHLAACDVALVQGGLTTTMELVAGRRPFVYVPLEHHFEQQVHVPQRLARYGAGHRTDYATTRDPQALAAALAAQIDRPVDYRPVETDGAARTAAMLAELL